MHDVCAKEWPVDISKESSNISKMKSQEHKKLYQKTIYIIIPKTHTTFLLSWCVW